LFDKETNNQRVGIALRATGSAFGIENAIVVNDAAITNRYKRHDSQVQRGAAQPAARRETHRDTIPADYNRVHIVLYVRERIEQRSVGALDIPFSSWSTEVRRVETRVARVESRHSNGVMSVKCLKHQLHYLPRGEVRSGNRVSDVNKKECDKRGLHHFFSSIGASAK
jgi:hypothetical protein